MLRAPIYDSWSILRLGRTYSVSSLIGQQTLGWVRDFLPSKIIRLTLTSKTGQAWFQRGRGWIACAVRSVITPRQIAVQVHQSEERSRKKNKFHHHRAASTRMPLSKEDIFLMDKRSYKERRYLTERKTRTGYSIRIKDTNTVLYHQVSALAR